MQSRFRSCSGWSAAAIVGVALSICASGSLSAAGSDAERLPGEVFRDCPDCAELVIVPSGEFDMGSKAKSDRAARSPRQHSQELRYRPPRRDIRRMGPVRRRGRLQVQSA